MNRYLQLATYFRYRFAERVQKIPLDAGATCPNRDGTLSSSGCIFCNPSGSGSGMGLQGMNLNDQWDFWYNKYTRSQNARLFIAYLQSFSNTYGPPEKLSENLDSIASLQGVMGVSIGTRPDCINVEKLDIIAKLQLDEVWLELGLQSAHDRTLTHINRGHSYEDFVQAVTLAAERNINVCVHLIAGLPNETIDDFLQTVEMVSELPIRGIKFHSLYVAEDTVLETMWRNGEYTPMTEAEFIDAIARAVPKVPSTVVVQRLTGDALEGELLAPHWGTPKRVLVDKIMAELVARDMWQGKEVDAQQGIPLWFTIRENLPRRLREQWDAEYDAVAEQLGFLPRQ
ncbi:TIGR01212 family radical SAM protein [Halodesulfovibrio spirochaetisodalis]|uniref:Radical SAM protein n=1 Tax=Halodesulfovibrio spirochaetisodalis TaxID=1560234 RepID=A0A1B7XBX9_9BACT|nr:TIGR01212 family radical SAM protein [Halodesulfovibrio spirochaetisodalis]OBQ50257.1 radical SAM protein [Halodesulfovibrio spirochaetisodalis]